jgi:hypothetical protein
MRFRRLVPSRHEEMFTAPRQKSRGRPTASIGAKHCGFLDLDHAKRAPMGKRRDKLLNQSWQLNR